MEPQGKGMTKRQVFESLYDQGIVAVVFDRHALGVVVPPECQKGEEPLILQYSKRYRVRVEWDDEDLAADLNFGPHTHTTVVPWAAVSQIMSDVAGMAGGWTNATEQPEKKGGLRLVH